MKAKLVKESLGEFVNSGQIDRNNLLLKPDSHHGWIYINSDNSSVEDLQDERESAMVEYGISPRIMDKIVKKSEELGGDCAVNLTPGCLLTDEEVERVFNMDPEIDDLLNNTPQLNACILYCPDVEDPKNIIFAFDLNGELRGKRVIWNNDLIEEDSFEVTVI